MNNKFEKGQLIQVSDFPFNEVDTVITQPFVCEMHDRFYTDTGMSIVGWKYARPLQNLPGHNRDNITTLPKGAIRLLDHDEIILADTKEHYNYIWMWSLGAWVSGVSGSNEMNTYATSLTRDQLAVKRHILKTCVEWIDTITSSSIRMLALSKYDEKFEHSQDCQVVRVDGKRYYRSFENAIYAAFSWSSTPQGICFWKQVSLGQPPQTAAPHNHNWVSLKDLVEHYQYTFDPPCPAPIWHKLTKETK